MAKGFVLEKTEAEFMSRVEKKAGGGCWIWTGTFRTPSRLINPTFGNLRAANFSYEMFIGEIIDGLTAAPNCGVNSCVNPDHLSLFDFSQRGAAAAAARDANKRKFDSKPLCRSGHELAIFGSRVGKSKRRVCRECTRLRMAKRRARQGAGA